MLVWFVDLRQHLDVHNANKHTIAHQNIKDSIGLPIHSNVSILNNYKKSSKNNKFLNKQIKNRNKIRNKINLMRGNNYLKIMNVKDK